jgi:hypothetical protein
MIWDSWKLQLALSMLMLLFAIVNASWFALLLSGMWWYTAHLFYEAKMEERK